MFLRNVGNYLPHSRVISQKTTNQMKGKIYMGGVVFKNAYNEIDIFYSDRLSRFLYRQLNTYLREYPSTTTLPFIKVQYAKQKIR
jgi:hypothetical protein